MALATLTLWLKRLQWARGLRAAIAIGSTLLASHALNLPPAAAALGAFNPLLVDTGGPYRTRLSTMLTTIFGGALSFILGALVPHHLAAVVPITLLFGFAITYARVIAQPIASSSVLILVLYFAGLGGTQHTLRGAAFAAALVIVGGIWSILLSLTLWPIDPFRPARQAVARCYLWMSGFTSTLAKLKPSEKDELDPDPGFEWRRQQRIRIEEARLALSSTWARAPSRSLRARNLTVLLETSDMLLGRTMRLSELLATAAGLQLAASSALAGDLARWLAGAEKAIASALEAQPADAAESFAREGSSRLQFVVRRRELIAGRDSAQEDSLVPHLLREEHDALLEIEVAFDALRALWTGTEVPASSFTGGLQQEKAPSWLDALQSNATLASAAFRHAIRMAVVGTIDVIVMNAIHINHGFWLPMTSIILLQPFSAGTVRKSFQRVTGTVAGGIFAALLAAALGSPEALFVVVTALSALTVATFAVDYAVYCFFLTPTWVLLSLPYPHDWRYAFIRVGTTLAGATIAILAMHFVWPERADLELSRLMQRGAAAASAYLSATVSFWQLDPAARQNAERTLLAPARRACGLASNDAEEAVDRVMQEPTFGRRADAETTLRQQSLTFVTYMRRLTQSITTLAIVGSSSPATLARLQPIVERLQQLATGRPGDTLQQTDGPQLPLTTQDSRATDLAEEQLQRLERQTAVLERAASAIWLAAPAVPETS